MGKELRIQGNKGAVGLLPAAQPTLELCVLYTLYQREVLMEKVKCGVVFGLFKESSSQAERQERENKGQQIRGGSVIVYNCAAPWCCLCTVRNCMPRMARPNKSQALSTVVVVLRQAGWQY